MASSLERPQERLAQAASGALRSHAARAVDPAAAPLHPLLRLQRVSGNRAVQRLMTVNAPGDVHEQEADRVADAVMRMPESGPVRVGLPAAAGIQRKCAACEAGGETCPDCGKEEELRRKPSEAAAFDASGTVSADAADRVDRLRSSGGRPLPAEDRAFFEPRLGYDLGGVRIHTGAAAADSARELQAQAYTTGSDIVFGSGSYAPQTPQGRHLLAHELVHVVQQGGGAAAGVSRRIQRQSPGGSTHAGPSGPGAVPQIPAEKWSETIEGQYRRRGDTARADAIRDCRTRGVDACKKLITVDEAYRLFHLARSSGGDPAKVEAGLMMGGLAPQLWPQPTPPPSFPPGQPWVPPRPPVPPTGWAPPPPVAPPTPAPPVTTPGPAPGPGTGVRPGPGAGAVGPAILVTILVLAGTELWAFGQFQAELQAQGYLILENPLAVCIGGCHTSPSPASPQDLPDLGRLPRTPPGNGPLTPKEIDDIMKFLEGTKGSAQPAPQPTLQPFPQAQPAPGPRRYPDQTCENDVLDALQREKDRICNSIPGDSCSPKKVSPKRLAKRPCSEIRQRIRAIQDCLVIRNTIQRDCFGGKPDKVHQDVLDNLQNGLQACLLLEAQNCAPGHPMAGL